MPSLQLVWIRNNTDCCPALSLIFSTNPDSEGEIEGRTSIPASEMRKVHPSGVYRGGVNDPAEDWGLPCVALASRLASQCFSITCQIGIKKKSSCLLGLSGVHLFAQYLERCPAQRELPESLCAYSEGCDVYAWGCGDSTICLHTWLCKHTHHCSVHTILHVSSLTDAWPSPSTQCVCYRPLLLLFCYWCQAC